MQRSAFVTVALVLHTFLGMIIIRVPTLRDKFFFGNRAIHVVLFCLLKFLARFVTHVPLTFPRLGLIPRKFDRGHIRVVDSAIGVFCILPNLVHLPFGVRRPPTVSIALFRARRCPTVCCALATTAVWAAVWPGRRT